MPVDPTDPPSQAEKNVFGEGARLHPVTGMALENGRGALADDQQALIHIGFIERQHGKAAADDMRGKLTAYLQEKNALEGAKKVGAPLLSQAPLRAV